jgi:multiple sugar transport system substrate-binding protein
MDQEKDSVTSSQPISATSRKDFLKTAGAVAAGAAAVAAGAPAIAQAAVPERARVVRDLAPITLTVYRGSVTTGHDYELDLFNKFMKQNPNIKIKSLFAPLSTTDEHSLVVAQLSGGSGAVDLYSGDVIWPPEFAAAGWILPVDKWITEEFRADLLPGPKLGTTVNGKMYAFPFFTDSGIFVYRTDLLSKYKLPVPQTWSDVIHAAQTVLAHEKSVPNGVLWQGLQYEGLFCDICELFWGNGGNVLQNFTGPKVVLDSPNNRAALQFMVDAIQKYKIAPLAVTTYKEDDTRHLWEAGKSVFMRNWPYVWALGNKPGSKVAGKFGIAKVPHGPMGKSASCLGGWNMMINAKSANPDAAAKLALFLTSFESQKFRSMTQSSSPTRASVYSDPEVLKVNPWYKSFFPVIKSALPRPVSKYETKISDRITRQVHAALLKQIDVATALKNAQKDVEQIVGGNTP